MTEANQQRIMQVDLEVQSRKERKKVTEVDMWFMKSNVPVDV